MSAPSRPPNEPDRLAALLALDILDTPPEERFDRIVAMARDIFDVPIALVSLVDEKRQWFKARAGLDAEQTCREISFCGHAILAPEPFIIQDALEDDRFVDNPLVKGPPHIRFYASQPLMDEDGHGLGTLCIIDTKPRGLDPTEISILGQLAGFVNSELHAQDIRDVQANLVRATSQVRQFFDHGSDLMCVSGLDGTISQANPRFTSILGYAEGEILSQTIFDLVHPEDVEDMRRDWTSMQTGEANTLSEARCRCKDGSYRWLQWACTPFLEESLVFSNARDITDHKRALQEREFEEIIHRVNTLDLPDRSVSEVFEDLLFTLLERTDSEYGFIGEVLYSEEKTPYLRTHAITDISWNEETRAFYQENAPEGLKFYNLKTLFGHVMTTGRAVIANEPASDPRRGGLPEGHPPLRRFLGAPFHAGGQMVGMVGIANRPGGYSQALVRDLQPLLSACAAMIQISRNMESRREAEATLRESADVIRRLYEISTEQAPVETRIQHMLQLGCDTLSMELGILSAVKDTSYVVRQVEHPDDIPVDAGSVFDLGDTYCSETLGASDTVSVSNASKHSRWRSHPAYSAFRLDAYIGAPVRVDGQVVGTINFSARHARAKPFGIIHHELVRLMSNWVGVALEREKGHERLTLAKEAAEHANVSKSQFLATMSHELRTPLNSVIGFANLLIKQADYLDEDHRLFLERIEANGLHLLDLINDVLDISKVEAGKLELKPDDVDVRHIVREVTDQLRVQAESKSLSLEALVPEAPVVVFADPARLKQVLINLVGNAVKFTERGRVDILVDGTVAVPTVTIRDTGIGIEQDHLERIFENFQQVDNTMSRQFGGTGLGLPISQNLCQAMGFDLTVTSVPGKGSSFTIVLNPHRETEGTVTINEEILD